MGVIKPVSNKLIVESAIDRYNHQYDYLEAENKKQEMEARKAFKEAEVRQGLSNRKQVALKRFHSFGESVTAALLGEAVYRIFERSIDESLLYENGSKTLMRIMVSDFITEDASNILFKMRNKTVALSEMYNLITETKKKILESVDKEDPTTFKIDADVRDEFFDKLDTLDTDSITDAIRERVSSAVDEFMDSNKRDHDQILHILQATKDKLEEKEREPEEVKESYSNMSKRAIAKVRNRKKSVFESMVSAICESVMKNDNLKEEFTENGKLNVPKIVDRTTLMYTFIEAVNTMRLYPIDEHYMQDLIESLRK